MFTLTALYVCHNLSYLLSRTSSEPNGWISHGSIFGTPQCMQLGRAQRYCPQQHPQLHRTHRH